MKKMIKFVLLAFFAMLAVTPQMVANNLSPFGVNEVGIAPGEGTASPADVFQNINDLAGMETNANEFIAPAWLEILVLVSPANFPISTFLTQKTLDGIRGLAKAESMAGKMPDYLIETPDGKTRFNQKYAIHEDAMKNYKQFTNESVSNYKLNWGEIAVIPFQDTVSGLFAGGATSGTITVNNIKMWTRGALLKVQNKTYGTGEELVVYVNEVNTGTNTLSLVSVADDGSREYSRNCS